MLHGRIHPLLLPALLVALLGALLVAPAAHAAKGHFGAPQKASVIRANHVHGATATFRLRGAAAGKCRSARIQIGRRGRKVAARRVRAAAGRRSIRLPLRRAELRAARRSKPKLVIYATPEQQSPNQGTIAPTAPASTDPAPSHEPAPTGSTTDSPVTATPTGDPAPTGAMSTTRPAGSAVLSDAAAAALVRASGAEKRPVNSVANQRIPTESELAAFRAANSSLHAPHEQLVTGAFRGTTDEIIQWAAWKWGIDEDVFRAQAVVETWWSADFVGDAGQSFGLFQIKRTVHLGTYPLSADSTAFNADYTGALFRYYYDGHATWLNDVEHGQPYTSGDMWGSLGAHYAGRWWAAGAQTYVDKVKQTLAERTWAQSSF